MRNNFAMVGLSVFLFSAFSFATDSCTFWKERITEGWNLTIQYSLRNIFDPDNSDSREVTLRLSPQVNYCASSSNDEGMLYLDLEAVLHLGKKKYSAYISRCGEPTYYKVSFRFNELEEAKFQAACFDIIVNDVVKREIIKQIGPFVTFELRDDTMYQVFSRFNHTKSKEADLLPIISLPAKSQALPLGMGKSFFGRKYEILSKWSRLSWPD